MMFSKLPLESLKGVNEKRYHEIKSIMHHFRKYEALMVGKQMGLTYQMESLSVDDFEILMAIHDEMLEHQKTKQGPMDGRKNNIRPTRR